MHLFKLLAICIILFIAKTITVIQLRNMNMVKMCLAVDQALLVQTFKIRGKKVLRLGFMFFFLCVCVLF